MLPRQEMLLRSRLLLAILLILSVVTIKSHQESGEWACDADRDSLVSVEFRPAVITLDGRADDWKDVEGFEFPLFPALDPDEDKQYKAGTMTVKSVHDGKDVFFLLEVGGDFVYSKGNDNKCPSIAMMFKVGEKASYHNMGGCKESVSVCNHTNCRGFEVDIVHFSIGSAIPGRIYDGNSVGSAGDTVTAHLVDLYAWSPHCLYPDGLTSGNSNHCNEWKGVWWHDSCTRNSGLIEEDSPYGEIGEGGMYRFELSRPLRTTDRFEQDVQFTIGGQSRFSVAFWYPPGDGNPWRKSGHYSVSCDWVPLEFSPPLPTDRSSREVLLGSFAAVVSLAAFCISAVAAYRLFAGRSTADFQRIDHVQNHL